MWETWVQSLGWEDPLEKGKATHSSILAWRILWGAKSQTWLSKFHFTFMYLNICLKDFWFGPFLKSLFNLLQCCFCLAFCYWCGSMWALSCLTRDQILILCFGRGNLNHWTFSKPLHLNIFFLFWYAMNLTIVLLLYSLRLQWIFSTIYMYKYIILLSDIEIS